MTGHMLIILTHVIFLCSVRTWGEGDAPTVPQQEPHPGGPQDRRQFRVGGEWLQQRHMQDIGE